MLGLTLPDPDLRLDEATGHYDFGAIDWAEFFAVLKGDGPCNAAADRAPPPRARGRRLGARGGVAYADKQAARRAQAGAA